MLNNIPWELFAKLFNDNITDAETRDLKFWRDTSVLNWTIYEEILEDNQIKDLLVAGRWNSNSRNWQKILKKIKMPGKRIGLPRRTLFAVAGIAATIMLLLGIYAIMQFNHVKQLKSAPGYTHIFSPRGQRTSLVLPDNTKVWLNGESSLRYSANYNQSQREVFLDGEAFFEVSKNNNKPFLVNAAEIQVKVYGTSFNIKAFSKEKFIETTLIEGKLSVIPIKSEGEAGAEIYLKPKEKCIYEKASGEISREAENVITPENASRKQMTRLQQNSDTKSNIIIEKNINAEQEEFWKDGKLIFRNETFDLLAIKLERWYDVKIHFEDEGIRSYKFTGVFEKETINQAMEALRLSSKRSYRYNIVFRDIYLRIK